MNRRVNPSSSIVQPPEPPTALMQLDRSGWVDVLLAAWLAEVFCSDPEGLWGFRHLTRLSPREFAWFVSLGPLVLAPGWRQLARRLRLAWLERTRRRLGGAQRPSY